MAAKGIARIYTEKVRFVTGVPYPVKKPETGTAASLPSSVSAPGVKTGDAVKPAAKKPLAAAEKPGRKMGRNAFTAQTGRKFN
jgi:hypothetical protein